MNALPYIILSTILALIGMFVIFIHVTNIRKTSNAALNARNIAIGMFLVIMGTILYIIPIIQLSSMRNVATPSDITPTTSLVAQQSPVATSVPQRETSLSTPLIPSTISIQETSTSSITVTITHVSTIVPEQECPSLTWSEVAILEQVSSLSAAQIVAQSLSGSPPLPYKVGDIIHANWVISTTATLDDVDIYNLNVIIRQEGGGLFVTTRDFQSATDGKYWCVE